MSTEQEKLTDATGAPAQTGASASQPVPEPPQTDEQKQGRAAEAFERIGNAFTAGQTGVSDQSLYTSSHHHRTKGLKIFDAFLYPFLTNMGVFVTSVVATYLTSHGDKTGGQVGKFFFKRGQWLTNQMTEKLHWKPATADMAKMVTFSFLDGSLMAPLVKMLEDRREKFARKLDTVLGTKPEDESVYAAEPKQSWLSVLGGRLGVVSIVVPTAVALNKTGLNDKLFSNPGKKTGEWVAKKPNLAKYFGSLDIPGLFRTTFFEFFYTSVCTAGLYFSSRFLARMKKQPPRERVPPAAASPVDDEAQAKQPTQESAVEKTSFAEAVGKKNLTPKENAASMVERYQQETTMPPSSTAIH